MLQAIADVLGEENVFRPSLMALVHAPIPRIRLPVRRTGSELCVKPQVTTGSAPTLVDWLTCPADRFRYRC